MGRLDNPVSIVDPIKRGLKVRLTLGVVIFCNLVSIVDPIKRGLKEPWAPAQRFRIWVSIVDPIKRGLKGESGASLRGAGYKFQLLTRLKGD